jgi:hypothetical protein
LIDLNINESIEPAEIKTIEKLIFVLKPIELTVKEMSKENSNLIIAEGIFVFYLINSERKIQV